MAATDLVSGPDRQFHESGAGEEDGARDGVVGEPGVTEGGEAAGEDDSPVHGQTYGGAQEGVVGCGQAGAGDIGGSGAGLQPVAAVLEGVRREVDAVGGAACVDGGPVDVGALDPEFSGTCDEAGALVLVPAETDVTVDAHVGIGNIQAFGREENGIDADLERISGTAGAQEVELDLEVGIGSIRVELDD